MAELQGQIFTLDQIQDEEKFSDSLVTVGAASPAMTEAEMDTTIPDTQNVTDDIWPRKSIACALIQSL